MSLAKRFNVNFDYSVTSLSSVDSIIESIYKMRGQMNEDILWNISVSLGAYVGEVFLNDRLRDHGFYWAFNKENIPVVYSDKEIAVSPITRLYKILYHDDPASMPVFHQSFWLLYTKQINT